MYLYFRSISLLSAVFFHVKPSDAIFNCCLRWLSLRISRIIVILITLFFPTASGGESRSLIHLVRITRRTSFRQGLQLQLQISVKFVIAVAHDPAGYRNGARVTGEAVSSVHADSHLQAHSYTWHSSMLMCTRTCTCPCAYAQMEEERWRSVRKEKEREWMKKGGGGGIERGNGKVEER